jgi:diguanylate cyclase (GGDEF)-like protein/PAS domain S-box-containing protein
MHNRALINLTKLFTQDLDFSSLLCRILEADTDVLNLARVSIWLFDRGGVEFQLVDLYESATKTHHQGGVLKKEDYPSYFKAVETSRTLIIDDVFTHAATSELLNCYLNPLGITSMLDAPIIVEGALRGVVCHEHIGPARTWTPAESGFAASIADLIGQAILVDELRKTRTELRDSEERARLLFSSNPVALLLVDEQGRIRDANRRAAELFRTRIETLEQRNVDDLIPSRLRSHHAKYRETYYLSPSHRPMAASRELVAKALDDTEFPAEVGLCPVTIGKTQHVICALTDITDRKQAESQLRVLSTAIEQTPATVMILDTDGNIQFVNPYFTRETGKSVHEVLGLNIRALSPGLNCEGVYDDMWQTLNRGEAWVGELISTQKNGGILWEEAHIAPVKDEKGLTTHFVAIKLNITQRKENEAMMLHYALHDTLTDLPNRKLLNDRLRLSMESARRNNHQLALLFLDLDYFKQINDSLGHEVGDLVLQETAQRMKGQLRGMDTVARIGGDEFVILLPKVMGAHDALTVAEKIRQAVGLPIVSETLGLKVTCSIGIALFPKDASNDIELYRHADQALYKVKESGRNSVQVFHRDKDQHHPAGSPSTRPSTTAITDTHLNDSGASMSITLNPAHTAIILIGYQIDYFSPQGALYTVVQAAIPRVLGNTLATLNRLRNTGVKIISTPILFTPDYSELIEPIGILKTIKDCNAFRADSPGGETIPEIKAFGDRILQVPGKRGLNAFSNTQLHKILMEHGVTNVVLMGVVTSLCIEATGREAFEHGYHVSVISDATAGRTAFEQDYYCSEIFPKFADVMDHHALLAQLAPA